MLRRKLCSLFGFDVSYPTLVRDLPLGQLPQCTPPFGTQLLTQIDNERSVWWSMRLSVAS